MSLKICNLRSESQKTILLLKDEKRLRTIFFYTEKNIYFLFYFANEASFLILFLVSNCCIHKLNRFCYITILLIAHIRRESRDPDIFPSTYAYFTLLYSYSTLTYTMHNAATATNITSLRSEFKKLIALHTYK